MLILTRRTEQTLMIGDRVTVTVLQVRGDRVRFGVNAPHDIRVQRADKTTRAPTATDIPDGRR
jgi:carbon storage regulator